MPLDIGDRTVGAGTLAKSIFDELKVELDGFDPDAGDNDATLARIAAAFAKGVGNYLVANADVRITTGDSALQRDDASTNDTLGPSVDRVLSGAIE